MRINRGNMISSIAIAAEFICCFFIWASRCGTSHKTPERWERGALMGRGRPKKFKTAKDLEKHINRYFNSISRTITVRERYATGDKDQWGRDVYEWRDVYNDHGDPVRTREYVVPPTLSGLCLYLGISRQAWNGYCNDPEFLDTTTRARARCELYLEDQLISRTSNVQGLIFNLQNNYGWKERKELELGDQTRKEMAINRMSLADKLKLIEEAHNLSEQINGGE